MLLILVRAAIMNRSTLLSHILVVTISFFLPSLGLEPIKVTCFAKSVKIGIIGIILTFKNHFRVLLNNFLGNIWLLKLLIRRKLGVFFLNLRVDLTNFSVQLLQSLLIFVIFSRRSLLAEVRLIARNLMKLLKSLFNGFRGIQSTLVRI